MQTVVAIYTGQGLADPLKEVFKQVLPDVKLVNIIDDSLIGEVVKAGKVPASTARRLFKYYEHAEEIGADVIFNTCSSVGEIADQAQAFFDTPIVKIDQQMAIEAALNYKKIAVLATLPTTLEPTMRLIEKQAELHDREIQLVNGLAAGAFDALTSGDPKKHDAILMEIALAAAKQGVEAIVLAQGSMARMQSDIEQATGIKVLSSPVLGVLNVKDMLGRITM